MVLCSEVIDPDVGHVGAGFGHARGAAESTGVAFRLINAPARFIAPPPAQIHDRIRLINVRWGRIPVTARHSHVTRAGISATAAEVNVMATSHPSGGTHSYSVRRQADVTNCRGVATAPRSSVTASRSEVSQTCVDVIPVSGRCDVGVTSRRKRENLARPHNQLALNH